MTDLPIKDLKSALDFLVRSGETIILGPTGLSPDLRIPQHYAQAASSPATGRTGDEAMHLYPTAQFPVLLGLFGARRRNNLLIAGTPTVDKASLASAIAHPVPPVILADELRKRRELTGARLNDLPILRYTDKDAGHYITTGIVYAKHPRENIFNLSIHRLCVIDERRCTIWMVPGRHLESFYKDAVSRGESLPVSINVGGDPIFYLTSSFSPPLVGYGCNELGIAGAIRGRPMELFPCKSSNALGFARADFIIEGELTAERADEGATGCSMPEFLGYMGESKRSLPVLSVRSITTVPEPIYQTVLGPGREQSELLAIPQEIAILSLADGRDDFQVVDVHCPSFGGGLLVSVIGVCKNAPESDRSIKDFGKRILEKIRYVKLIVFVDDDVDVHSPEDVLWAMTTRMQADMDISILPNFPGFPMDPSQASDYRHRDGMPGDAVGGPVTSKAVFDCTAPFGKRTRFSRASFHVA